MFERFQSFNTTGSNRKGYESASACASFFAALLLLIDTVLAVSIFVSADLLGALIIGVVLSILVCLIRICVLILAVPAQKRPSLSAA